MTVLPRPRLFGACRYDLKIAAERDELPERGRKLSLVLTSVEGKLRDSSCRFWLYDLHSVECRDLSLV